MLASRPTCPTHGCQLAAVDEELQARQAQQQQATKRTNEQALHLWKVWQALEVGQPSATVHSRKRILAQQRSACGCCDAAAAQQCIACWAAAREAGHSVGLPERESTAARTAGNSIRAAALTPLTPNTHCPPRSPSASAARPPTYSAALPRGQAFSAAAASCTNWCAAGFSAAALGTPAASAAWLSSIAAGRLLPLAGCSARSQDRSCGTIKVATRLPLAPAGAAVAATADAMAAPRSSPGVHVCTCRLCVCARAEMSLHSSGSAAWCHVAMSPASKSREVAASPLPHLNSRQRKLEAAVGLLPRPLFLACSCSTRPPTAHPRG